MNNRQVAIIKKNVNSYNGVYGMVKDLLKNLGFDRDNAESGSWNPFKDFVKRGSNVVIKPNLVFSSHPMGQEGILSMITHASVARPLIDYILLATDGKVNITICDVPLQSADWESLIEIGGYKDLINFYENKGIKINLLDLRREIALVNQEGVCYKKIKKNQDPLGYIAVDLGKKSYFQDIVWDYKKLEITDYESGAVAKHHNFQKNEYLIPKTILSADVFINLPKMKTHKKAGVTLSLKNLIGVNGDKSWIAHHRRGIDEYPIFKLTSYLKWYSAYYIKKYANNFIKTVIYKYHRILKERGVSSGISFMEGNWYGNDTLWRSILDLNNIIFFCDKYGQIKETQQRKYLSVVDGIISMEGEGPMHGHPRKDNIIIGGFHPVAIDYLASYVMGFDYQKIPQIKEGFNEKFFILTPFNKNDVLVNSNINWEKTNLKFKPSKGWINHIERKENE